MKTKITSLITAGILGTTLASQAAVVTVPTGLSYGDQYRLVFVTSTTTAATDTDISYYNDFVNTAADLNSDLDAISWTAIGSTDSVDAIDNTSTTGTGVSIYLLNDTEFAPSYTAMWAGNSADITNPLQIDEQGNNVGNLSVWTGTDRNGTVTDLALGDPTGDVDYGSTRFSNIIPSARYWIGRDFDSPDTDLKPLYAISGVLTAVPEPSSAALLGLAGLALILRRRK